MKRTLLISVLTANLLSMAAADPLEDLAAQIRRDEAQVRQQTNTNTEAEKARHMEEMRQEMKRSDDQLAQEREEARQREIARQQALEAAKDKQMERENLQANTDLTKAMTHNTDAQTQTEKVMPYKEAAIANWYNRN
jgi:hypothetical protein